MSSRSQRFAAPQTKWAVAACFSFVAAAISIGCGGPKGRGGPGDDSIGSVSGAITGGSGTTSTKLLLQVSKNACAANVAQDYFKVTNSSTASVPLSSLAIKYWINDTTGVAATPQIFYGGCVTSANGTCVHPVTQVTAKATLISPACGPDGTHQAGWEITISTADATPLAVGQTWSNLQTAVNLTNHANFVPGTGTWFSRCGTGQPYASDPSFAVYFQGNLVIQQGVAVPSCRAPDAVQIQTWIDNRFYSSSDIISSYAISSGDQIDCIDFSAQHSVKAWLAQGVTIPPIPAQPMPAASTPPPNAPLVLAQVGTLDQNGHIRQCPNGAVPVMRPSVALIQAAGGVDAYRQMLDSKPRRLMGTQDPLEHDCWLSTDKGSGNAPADGTVDWEHASGIQTFGWLPTGAPGYYGMEITTPFYTPFVQVASDHTDTQLWAQTGHCEHWYTDTDNCTTGTGCTNCTGPTCDSCAVQSLEVVSETELEGSVAASPGVPAVPGAPVTRVHVFFTTDGYKTSCFVGSGGACPGCPTLSNAPDGSGATDCWMGVSGAPVPPNVALSTSAGSGPGQYGVTPVELNFKVWNGIGASPSTPGWWVYVNRVLIGYLPPQSFNWSDGSAGAMSNGPVTYLQAGGEVMNSWPNSVHTDTSMVSDNVAQAGFGWAAYQRNVTYFDQSSAPHPADLKYQVSGAAEQDNNFPGLCGFESGGWTDAANARGAYSIAPSFLVPPAGGSDWGTYFYFGGGRLAQQRCPIVPHTPGAITEFPLPDILFPVGDPPPPNLGPTTIVAGTDCNVWFIFGGETVARLSPSGQFAGNANSEHVVLHGLTAGPDGNMWVAETTDPLDPKIGRVNASFARTLFDQAGILGAFQISSLTLGPGGKLWFGAENNTIGTITTDGTTSIVTTGASPFQLANGPDGALWFTNAPGTQIGRVPATGGAPTYFPIPSATEGTFLTAGPDGNIWFLEPLVDKIAKVVPGTGAMTEFSLAAGPLHGLDAIGAGPDGNVWFTEDVPNKIGKITPGGQITEFSIGVPPPNNVLGGIGAGPDGNIWFAETAANKVGRMTPP